MQKKKLFIISSILIVCLIVAVLSTFVAKKRNEYNYIVDNIKQIEYMRKDISDCLDWTVIKSGNGYISNKSGIHSAASKITTYAAIIGDNVVCVERELPHIKEKTINKIIKHETINNGMYKTWEEYKTSLTKKYYLGENLTDYERANKIIKSYVDLKAK